MQNQKYQIGLAHKLNNKLFSSNSSFTHQLSLIISFKTRSEKIIKTQGTKQSETRLSLLSVQM